MTPDDQVEKAVEILRQGGLVALPTETVYGLAADAGNELAVRRIFAVKGRPSTHPLIVHLLESGVMSDWARAVPEPARRLAQAFWPGPLTLVLPRTRRASDAVTGGQDTVALRVPDHPLALAVLRKLGGGLAAPSANRFGRISPTTAQHVRDDLAGEVDFVLDGGPCRVGVESTIVDLSADRPRLLRPGGVPAEAVERLLGRPLLPPQESGVRAPGLLPSHYAPRAGVILVPRSELAAQAQRALARGMKTAVLCAAPAGLPSGVAQVEIPSDAAALAHRLYALLREVDASGVDVMIIEASPANGLGRAVMDRLHRAAAARPGGS